MLLVLGSMCKLCLFDSFSSSFLSRSFGVILALLSKARRRRTQTSVDPFITSLVIVPHRDLAYQFHHWIERLVSSSETPGHSLPSLASVAQVIVRGAATPMASQQAAILGEPPHILIGTPQALLEMLSDGSIPHPGLLTISSVYVDEVDYMIDSVLTNSTKRTQEKTRRRMKKHPGAAAQLLDLLFASRRKRWEDEVDTHTSQVRPSDGPQLIMSSATLRHHLRNRLYGGSGWIDRGAIVKISGNGQPASHVSSKNSVAHCVLVVSEDGQVRNIDGAQEAIPPENGDSREINTDEIFNSPDTQISFQGEEVHESGLSLFAVISVVLTMMVRLCGHRTQVESERSGGCRCCLRTGCTFGCPPLAACLGTCSTRRIRIARTGCQCAQSRPFGG
jgi:hypothetical protein